MTIQIKALIPDEVLSVPQVRLALLNQFRKTGRRIKKKMEKTTATWKRKPTFEMKVSLKRRGGRGGVIVGTKNDIYRYLNDGTRVRWAVMSSNFRAKTRRRRLTSYKGRGGAVIAGRRAMTARGIGPRPGIQAREWTDVIRKQEKRPWERDVQAAINKGLNKARG